MSISGSPHPALRLVYAAERDSAAERRAAVAREVRSASLQADLDPADPRLILALQTQARLEGATLPAERRERLLKLANGLGLRPFDANLVIAIVQDEARRQNTRPHVSHAAADRLGPLVAARPATAPDATHRVAPNASSALAQRLAIVTRPSRPQRSPKRRWRALWAPMLGLALFSGFFAGLLAWLLGG